MRCFAPVGCIYFRWMVSRRARRPPSHSFLLRVPSLVQDLAMQVVVASTGRACEYDKLILVERRRAKGLRWKVEMDFCTISLRSMAGNCLVIHLLLLIRYALRLSISLLSLRGPLRGNRIFMYFNQFQISLETCRWYAFGVYFFIIISHHIIESLRCIKTSFDATISIVGSHGISTDLFACASQFELSR